MIIGGFDPGKREGPCLRWFAMTDFLKMFRVEVQGLSGGTCRLAQGPSEAKRPAMGMKTGRYG